MALSEEYKKVLNESRKIIPGWGSSWPGVWELRQILRKRGKTVLDFGCGLGNFRKNHGDEFEITNYDPSMPEWDTLPDGMWDAVVSNHVLEHIEPEYIDATLAEIRDRTRYVAVLTIPSHKAEQTLTDGRNAHLIVEPREWWDEKLRKVFPTTEWVHSYGKGPANVVRCTTFVIKRKQQ